MKKLFACLLAAVLSVGVISLAACSNQQTEDGGEEEFNKIPQIPAGVVLNDVAFENIEETRAKFNDSISTSKNIRTESYTHYKYLCEADGEIKSLNEDETYVKAKYLDKDGKTYGESTIRNFTHVTYKTNYVDVEDFFHISESDLTTTWGRTAFLSDKNHGVIFDGSTIKGHGKDISSISEFNKEWEKDEKIDKSLEDFYINGEDYFQSDSHYTGMRILSVGAKYYPLPWLANAASFAFCSYGTEIHERYINNDDAIWLLYGSEYETVDYWATKYDFEIEHYEFIMQADDTKIYLNQDFKVNILDKEDKSLNSTVECTFVYYQDNESNLTPSNFKENYITDELVKDIYYYDCDEKQVAADFMAGKDVVINPVGGDDVSDNSFNYEDDYIKTSSSPYVAFVDGNKIIEGYIAGFVNDSHAKVENGKVIINSDGALDVAKEYAKSTIEHGHYDSFDLENAKMYLVITAPNYYGNYKLYIPLN